MGAITVRGIDNEISKALKIKAKEDGDSINSFVLEVIKEALGLKKKDRNLVYNDLDYLAGTWKERDYKNFKDRVAGFEAIDEKMWK